MPFCRELMTIQGQEGRPDHNCRQTYPGQIGPMLCFRNGLSPDMALINCLTVWNRINFKDYKWNTRNKDTFTVGKSARKVKAWRCIRIRCEATAQLTTFHGQFHSRIINLRQGAKALGGHNSYQRSLLRPQVHRYRRRKRAGINGGKRQLEKPVSRAQRRALGALDTVPGD